MNGIEKITERILADAQLEVDETLSKAQAEATKIRTYYETQANKERDEIVRRGAERAKEREGNLAGAAQLEARKDTLAAKQKMLDQAFAKAASKMAEISGADYVNLLASLAANAAFSGNERIVLSDEDRGKYGEAVVKAANERLSKAGKPANLSLSDDTRATGGGLLLSDGKIETNCTFETLLRLVRSEISGEVAAVLFD